MTRFRVGELWATSIVFFQLFEARHAFGGLGLGGLESCIRGRGGGVGARGGRILGGVIWGKKECLVFVAALGVRTWIVVCLGGVGSWS